MKKTTIIVLAFILGILQGCKKEYALPELTAPVSNTVEVNSDIDLSFAFSAEGGYLSSSFVATGGSASIKTAPSAGSVSGTIIVTFTAGSVSGAGSVLLTITDKENQTHSATAVLTIFEEGAPQLTNPANSEVTVKQAIDITFPFTAEGGYKSSELTASGGTALIKTDATPGATSGDIVVSFTADRTVGAGSVTLQLTDNNNKSGQGTAVITIKAFLAISVTANITEDTSWKSGNIYILEGRITIVSGVTLTIEPGVIIKGREGSEANATALLVARGSKLIADGNASSPIIFTSVADQILPGEIISPNLEPNISGLWGGLLILGEAPISAEASAMQIEGIPASDLNGLYGGSDAASNSGVLKYISIRHGGANIGEGNEINGLTLGGVGTGTVIENIEIVANDDDGVEFFGGTVNVKNVIVLNTGDDAIDTDQSWSGTLDNFLVINPGDECMELDGPEGIMAAKHTIKNGSCYAGDAQGLVDLDDDNLSSDSWVDLENIYFTGLKTGQDFNTVPDYYTCSFSNLEATIPDGTSLADFFKGGSDAFVTAVPEGANTVGCNMDVFTGWTWSSLSGILNELF